MLERQEGRSAAGSLAVATAGGPPRRPAGRIYPGHSKLTHMQGKVRTEWRWVQGYGHSHLCAYARQPLESPAH